MITSRPDHHILARALDGWPLDGHTVLLLATLVGVYLAFAVLLRLLWGRRHEEPEWMAQLVSPAYYVAKRSHRVVLVVLVLAFLSGLANGLVRYPIPAVNDEFGYLLTADTFSQGRLANEPHELWHHFETIGVTHQPAYIAKYPPGNSLFLALGQILFSHPWWGQLLAYSFAAAAVAWMLRAWAGPRWGMVGGLMVALHPNMQHFHDYDYGWANYSWSHSYWGGAAAMLGAALVFGGARNFLKRPRLGYGFAVGVGLVLLANTRPMEGLLVSLPIAALVAVRFFQGRVSTSALLGKLAAPIVAVAIPVVMLMVATNVATTGEPLRLAHQHYGSQYGVAAELLFQEPRTPPESYRNVEMERFYLEWVRPTFESRAEFSTAYLESRLVGLQKLFWYFFSTCWPALLALPLLGRDRWWLFAMGISAISLVLLLVVFDFHPHYAAPASPIFFALVVGGLMSLVRLHGGRSVLGRTVAVFVIAATLSWRAFVLPQNQLLEDVPSNDWPRMRAFVIEQLEASPGRDLVVVSTSNDHLMFQNWVHNGSDLENDEVLFARDLGVPLAMSPLVSHYDDRTLWLLELRGDSWSFRSVERAELLAGS